MMRTDEELNIVQNEIKALKEEINRIEKEIEIIARKRIFNRPSNADHLNLRKQCIALIDEQSALVVKYNVYKKRARKLLNDSTIKDGVISKKQNELTAAIPLDSIKKTRQQCYIALLDLENRKKSVVAQSVENNPNLSALLEKYLSVKPEDNYGNLHSNIPHAKIIIQSLMRELEYIFLNDENVPEDLQKEITDFLNKYSLKENYLSGINITNAHEVISLMSSLLVNEFHLEERSAKRCAIHKKIMEHEKNLIEKSNLLNGVIQDLHIELFVFSDDKTSVEINEFCNQFDEKYQYAEILLEKLKLELGVTRKSPLNTVPQSLPPVRSFTPPPSRAGAVTPPPSQAAVVTPLQTRFFDPDRCPLPEGDGFSPRAPSALTRKPSF